MLDFFPLELMWRTALGVIPLAMLVGVLSRVIPCRPATRHILWIGVLTVLLVAPFVPRISPAQISGFRDQAASWYANVTESATLQTMPDIEEHATQVVKKPVDESPASAKRLASAKRISPQTVSPKSPPKSSMRQRDRTPPAYLPGIPESNHASSAPRGMLFDNDKTRIGAIDSEPSKSPVKRNELGHATQGPQLIEWKQRLAVVGDAILNLPPIPLALWMGGIALLAGLAILRVGYSHRLIRTAQYAPTWIEQDVKEAAKELGLSRVPQVMMTHQRVSPMVWCGISPRLILPQLLWQQLDPPGRNAVIRHELAHLKRRDHWFAWLDLLIGCLYWWHPVVWWIRKRVREEADNCCDAWVMTLMPEGRRAYAVALLETKKCTSTSLLVAPVMGLGVAAGAKRFARRLNMVMTEQMVPRVSLRGVLLATIMVTVGSIVTPMWACPPDEKNQTVNENTPRARSIATSPETQATAITPESDGSTFERFMKGSESTETRTETVICTQPEAKSHSCCDDSYCDGSCCVTSNRKITQVLFSEDLDPIDSLVANPDTVVVADMVSFTRQSVSQIPAFTSEDDCDDEVIIRAYHLPRGKLKGLIGLMSRDDVPILITPLDDAIEVHATWKQHAVFGRFVNLIHPEGSMASDDDEYEDRIYEDNAYQKSERHREIRSQIRECTRNIEQLQREVERCERRSESLERRAQRRLDHARELREEAEDLEMEILEMEEKADGLENEEDQDRFMVEIEELTEWLQELEIKAEHYESGAEDLYSEIDDLEGRTEALEAESRMIEAHAEALEKGETEAEWVGGVDEEENKEDRETEEDN